MQAVTCGVYVISCSGNNTVYVGQSVNIKSRWRDHRKKLRAGKHYNKFMQSSFSKYGADSFTYHVALECSVDNLSLYEQLLADGYRATNVSLFNVGAYLPVPARGLKRPDNAKRLREIHNDPVRRALLMRGVTARAARIKGTPEAIAATTHASRSRTRKPVEALARKPSYLMLHKGTEEHSAMVSALLKRQYAEGVRVPNTKGRSVVRTDTGEVFISVKAIADVLGVSKSAVVHQIRHGSGVCRGVPITYLED